MTEFHSILSGDRSHDWSRRQPDFFSDLQLDYLLKIMERHSSGYDIRPYFYTMPADVDEIRFRQSVYRDFHREEIVHAFRLFCAGMQKSRRAFDLGRQCQEEIHRYSYHLESAVFYREALLNLREELDRALPESRGLQDFLSFLKSTVSGDECRRFFQDVQETKEKLDRLAFRLRVSEDRLTIEECGEEERDYVEDLREILQTGPESRKEKLTGIFPNALEPSLLETTLVQILERKNPDIFSAIREFALRYPSYYEEKLLQAEREVPFYLCSIEFERQTEKMGYPMSVPEYSAQDFSGEAVYDLALLWKQSLRDYTVVCNDFSYSADPSFFVITGPNQGGKTTFARSLGQAVYLALMGLNAGCRRLVLPFFTGISTHFEVEESVKSNSGKLKEEIDRLIPMMEKNKKRQFVILNELFTTATTYDATWMGKRVMEHFLDMDCYGIYVTHIQELAEETGNIQSLVAQIREDSQERTYRILPMKARGYGYSETLVKKFSLSYEDVIRRLP